MNAAHIDDGRELITLANGARIVLDPIPGLVTAAISVTLGAGARHESAELGGLAHFLEHMTFKGAGGLNARQIVEAVESRGAQVNAATGYERTSYTIRCLQEDAPDMLGHALSLALDADLPGEEIAREKQVVLQEIGEAFDEMDDRVFELLQSAAWPDHPLGRPILGAPETLERITRDDLAAFIDANYAADRTVVSIAGAFDRNAVIDLAGGRLESLRQRPVIETAAPVMASATAFEKRKAEQTLMVLSHPAPSLRETERFAARLLVEILGGGMSSRLYQEVREARGLAYAIDAAIDAYTDCGRIDVFCGCAPEDAMDVAKVVTDVWRALAEDGPSEEELSRAQAVQRASIAMMLESTVSREASSAYELLVLGELRSVEHALADIAAVTLENVRKVAAAALAGPATAAAIGPGPGRKAAEAFIAGPR